MTVALVMMVRDEEPILARAITSAAPLVDEIHVLDTGSTDGTPELAVALGARVHRAEWRGFGQGRTEALALARDHDWILMLDADQTVEDVSPGFRDWLPECSDNVLAVEITNERRSFRYRLPRLLRGGLTWRYEGVTHEALDTEYRARMLLGLRIVNHDDGAYRPRKHQTDLELLKPQVEAGEARAIYYSAQALWCLGRHNEAAVLYERRAGMNGWEEERWHAQYMAARLNRDVEALKQAHSVRPWRSEPLVWAARIVAEDNENHDVLFCEDD